jgi:Amt family ammonium transporter
MEGYISSEEFNETISVLLTELQQLKSNSSTQAFALDTVWVLTTAIGIVFMQTGFAMLEAGAVRAKNAKAILMKNLSDATAGALIWYVVGYGLFQGTDPWIGGNDPADPESSLFLIGSAKSEYMADFFQSYGFAVTTATIVSGGVASRMLFAPYIIFSLVMVGIIYPVIAHWAVSLCHSFALVASDIYLLVV